MDKEDKILKALNDILEELKNISNITDKNTNYTYKCNSKLESIEGTIDKLERNISHK